MPQPRRRKLSDRALQLREKQKARYSYGVLEKQFVATTRRRCAGPASPARTWCACSRLRLDNVVYRMGFADSRKQARQIVRHGHIMLNGRKTDIPSAHDEGRRRHRLDGDEQEDRVLQDRRRRTCQSKSRAGVAERRRGADDGPRRARRRSIAETPAKFDPA